MADVFIVSTASIDRWQCPPLDYSFLKFTKLLKKNNANSCFLYIGPYKPKRRSKNEFFFQANPEIKVHNFINKTFLHRGKYIDDKLTNLPVPDYVSVKQNKYNFPLLAGKFFIIESSRGCPYNCKLCFKDTMYPRYEKKSILQLKKELLELHKLGIRNMEFMDLDFLIDRRFALKICELFSSFSPGFRYSIETRCSNLDEELAKRLAESGCEIIEFGVETFSERILDKMNKKQSVADVKKAFTLCKKYWIKILAYMIVGFPGQTKKEIEYDFKMLKKLNPEFISMVPFIDYRKGKVYGSVKAKSITKRYYLRFKWIVNAIKRNNILDLLMNFRSFVNYLRLFNE